ncbi:hypothetical protein [Bartonella birtlesii]|uniref:hypothetical protein n=1 Tax=Bartonella birtlesii TaxID=111504 RepID=UPI000304D8AF|nr:hypothetical protein [Bartonella birtlesii]
MSILKGQTSKILILQQFIWRKIHLEYAVVQKVAKTQQLNDDLSEQIAVDLFSEDKGIGH